MQEHRIAPLTPLLLAAAIVIGANGLQFTVVAVRASHEGWSLTTIGVMSALFSLGFGAGCVFLGRLLSFLSHRLLFAIFILGSAVAIASMTLTTDPFFWQVARFLSGVAYAGLLTIVESHLNANVANSHRARALSLYRLTSLLSVSLAQWVIPLAGIDNPGLFLIISAALVVSLLPFAMFRSSAPITVFNGKPQLLRAWRVSPLAVLGAISSGLTVTTFRSTGAVYAHAIGLSAAEIATFMSAGLIGGLVLQYPLSFISDRSNRIAVIAMTMLGACLSELSLAAFLSENGSGNIIGIVAFGAFSFPLYALSAAHGNDRASTDGGYVAFAAAMLFFTSLGGTLGPLIVSPMMDRYGQESFLYYMFAVHSVVLAFALYVLWSRSSNIRSGTGR